MAHTKEQRDRHALCGARKKNGDKCRKFAGEGTEHPGIGTCKYHLGNARNNKLNAVKREAQRRAIQFGEAIKVEPTEALLTVLYLSAGHLSFIRDELAAREDKTTFDAQVLLRMWDDERDRVARIAKAALDAGVAERQITLAERYAEDMARLLRAVFYDPELGLTVTQRAQLPDVLRRHLLAMDGEQAALPAAPARGRSGSSKAA